MSNRTRLGLVVAAALVAVVAFVVISPGEESEQADDPATTQAQEQTTTETESTPTATAESAPPPPPEEIVLRGGAPEGGVQRIVVDKGSTVRMVVASDAQDEIHVHGYDLYRDTAPGQARAVPLQGQHRGRVRGREPHGRGRRPRAADRAARGRAQLRPGRRCVSLLAHGIVGRADLPIPEWLFGWAAAMVLVISFVALAVLWPRPRLQDEDFRPLPGGSRGYSPAARLSCCAERSASRCWSSSFGVACRGSRRPRPTSRPRSCS